MLFFSRRKKMIRDREAGMVFRWRGSRSGNTGGLTLAILLTTGVFALAFVGLNIRGDKKAPTTRRSAEIMLIEAGDPRLVQWLDGGSPFPARWDPELSKEHMGRVADVLEDNFAEVAARDFDWRELPDGLGGIETPAIYEAGQLIFPSLPEVAGVDRAEGNVAFEVRGEVMGVGGDRMPDVWREFSRDIPAEEYGKQWRWFVTLGANGEVEYCAPVEPFEGDFSSLLERWLRVQNFKVGEAGVTIEVLVEVVRREVADD